MHNFENKVFPTEARYIRNSFLDIVSLVSKHSEQNHNDYTGYRKDISAKFKSFAEFFKKHIKKNKGNEKCLEKMEQLLEPLAKVLDTNMRLTLVDFQFQDLDGFDTNNFKYKANIINFCASYQALQDKLLVHNIHNPDYKPDKDKKPSALDPQEEIKPEDVRHDLIYENSPDIYSVLKKFQYEGWRDNEVEKFYIQQLHDSFLKLRVNLSKLYSMGFNFWRIPISANVQLMADITSMVALENEIEVILGDRRKREQLNFMYEVLKVIYDGPSRKKLLDKREKLRVLSIPRLVALKSLQRINEIFRTKYIEVSEEEPYKEHEIEPPKPLIDFALMSATNPKEVRTHQLLLPPGHQYSEDIHLANDLNYTIEMDDNSIPELDKYGRFFMWPDYVPEEMYDEICDKAKKLRNINLAVLHDLEDYIIVQGMTSSNAEFHARKSKKIGIFNFFIFLHF